MGRKEVAKLAGVSEATVSRVLNGVGPIREATRARVLAAAHKLNYVPSALAQQFTRGRSGQLAVLIPFVPKVKLFSNHYFSELLSGIGAEASAHGLDLLLLLQAPDEPRDYARIYRQQKADGFIMLGMQQTAEEVQALERLQEAGARFCVVNQRYAHADFATVEADHVHGSRLAIGHLLAVGCKRIAFLNGPMSYSNSRDRLHGVNEALVTAGSSLEPRLVFYGNYSRTSGYEAATRVADAIRSDEVDGIFVGNDRMAIGLLQGLREQGVQPGSDVAVIGYDNSEGARYTEPQLSSIEVPFFEMGAAAVRSVIQSSGLRAGKSDAPVVQLPLQLPVQLVARASTLRFMPR